MASVFKRGRWVDATGKKCVKETPGAKYVESRFYTIAYSSGGHVKRVKGYSDRAASEQLAARLERAKAQGAEGMEDPYKAHRHRRLSEHVAEWVAELKESGRDDVYVGQCQTRLSRLMKECRWTVFSDMTPESFIRWRQSATATVGTAAKPGTNVARMAARTQNHYLEAARAFCRWAMRRKRLASYPLSDVNPVSTVGKLRRQRRALSDAEVNALLAAVPHRHQLAYRLILATGLRRDELRQLRWGDVQIEPELACLRLRAETTKGKRADVLPLRQDVAKLLLDCRGDAGENGRVCPTLPSMESHKRYLKRAGIAYCDGDGRRVDFHALRHTFGTMLAKAGIPPRLAMALMRHTDMALTMNVYTDPRVFDLAGAVEKLPMFEGKAPLKSEPSVIASATWRTESGTSGSAGIGSCSAGMGIGPYQGHLASTPYAVSDWHRKTPSNMDGVQERAKGFEPSTLTLGTSCSTN